MKKILISLILFICFLTAKSQFNPSSHVVINDALGQAQSAPLEGRGMFWDASTFHWRDFQNVAEVYAYLPTNATRFSHFPIWIHVGGTLSGGIWTGGISQAWFFKDGLTNGNLVRWYTDSAAVPNAVVYVKRLSDTTFYAARADSTRDTVLIRGRSSSGSITSLQFTAPSIFNSPVVFSNTGGAWTGALSFSNQSSGTVLAGPASGGPGPMTARSLLISDLPTGIPNGNLANSSITLSMDNTGTTPGFGTSPVALGGTIVFHNPFASATTSGPLTSTDWNRFNANTSIVTSVNGQVGAVSTRNADSIKNYPVDITNFRNGWVLALDTINLKYVFQAPSTGTGITSLNTLTATTQTFAIGSSGTSPNIVSSGGVHTFNTPIVNGADTGLTTPTQFNLWNAKQSALSGTGYSKWSGTTPSYLTATQVTADLNLFTNSLQGLTPASGGGTTSFLRADGTWATPPGGGGTVTGFNNGLTLAGSIGQLGGRLLQNTTVSAANIYKLTIDSLLFGLYFNKLKSQPTPTPSYKLLLSDTSDNGQVYTGYMSLFDSTGASALSTPYLFLNPSSGIIGVTGLPNGVFIHNPANANQIIPTTAGDTTVLGAIVNAKSKLNTTSIQVDGGTFGKNAINMSADSTQADTLQVTYSASGNFNHKHVVSTINGSNPTFVTSANLNLTDWTNSNISNGASQIFTQYIYRENAVGGSTRSAVGNFFNSPRVATGDSLGVSWGQIISFFNPNGKLLGLGGIHMSGTADFSNILSSIGIQDDNYTVNGGAGEHSAIKSTLAYGTNNHVINATGGAHSTMPWTQFDTVKIQRPIFATGTSSLMGIGADSLLGKIKLGTNLSISGDTLNATGGGGSGVTSVGSFSGSSQTNGASISTTVITFGPADATNPGMIKNTGSQTLGATLTMPAPLLTSLASSGANDSVVTVDPSTGQTHRRSGTFTLTAAQGLYAINSTTFGLGGTSFTLPDTIKTAGFDFLITGLPSKATALATDSVLIENITGKLFKLPVPSGGGSSQTLQQTLALGNTTSIAIQSSDSIASQLGSVRTTLKVGDTLAAVGRKIDYFFGTSIEAGYLLPDVSRSWPNQYCDLRGDSANTFSTLTGGKLVPTMTGQIATIPVYDSTKYNQLLFEYGLNDTTTRAFFKSEYQRIIDTVLIARGWPKWRVFIIASPYGGGTHRVDSIYSNAAIEAGISKGVRTIDFYNYGLTHNYLPTLNASDSIHPNVRGATILSNCAFNTVRDTVGGFEVNQLVVNKVTTLRSQSFFNGTNTFNGDIYFNDSLRNTAKFHDGVMIAGDGNIVEQRWIAYNGGPTNKFGIGVGNSGAGSYFLELYGGQAGGGTQIGTLTSNVFTATASATSTGLGIFNKSPAYALDVTGTSHFTGNSLMDLGLTVTGDNTINGTKINLYKSGNDKFGLGVNNSTGTYRTVIYSPTAQGGVDIGTISSADGTTYASTLSVSNVAGVGKVGIKQTTPTALLHIAAGTATAGTAPVKLTSGVVLTTPEIGAIEFNNGLFMGDSSNSVRDTFATRSWARNNITGGGGNTIYTGDGTLSSNRTVSGGNFSLSLGASGSKLSNLSVFSTLGLNLNGGGYNSTQGSQLLGAASTINNAITAVSGTVSNFSAYAFLAPTVTSTNASISYNNPATLRIDNSPTMSTNSTATGVSYALDVAAGISHFGVGASNISAVMNGVAAINLTSANSAYELSIGASTSGTCHLYLTPGADVTGSGATNSGAMWYNGTNLYFVDGSGTGVKRDLLGAIPKATADLTAQTTATTVTSFAVPGSGSFNTFRVGGYLTVTAVSLDVIQLQVAYTDETSTSRTQSFFVQGATTGISATGANGYSPIDIRAKQGTTITVSTILTTGTGSISYDAGASITQLY